MEPVYRFPTRVNSRRFCLHPMQICGLDKCSHGRPPAWPYLQGCHREKTENLFPPSTAGSGKGASTAVRVPHIPLLQSWGEPAWVHKKRGLPPSLSPHPPVSVLTVTETAIPGAGVGWGAETVLCFMGLVHLPPRPQQG